MSATNEMPDNFDFADVIKEKEEEEEKEEKESSENVIDKLTGKLGGKAKEIKKLKKQIATSGSLNPGIIKEARELAESPKGLNIDNFMQKHRLINIDLEQLLHAPLKKNGSFV